MEVEAGRAQTRVTKQQLDAAQVDAGFEQMRRKRVPERISTLLIIRRSFVFAIVTIPSLVRPSTSSDGYAGSPQKV